MANILDIFRTHTGEILLQKASRLTRLKEEQTRQVFTFSLPAILVALQNRSDLNTTVKHRNLITYIEDDGLISSGKENLEHFVDNKKLEALGRCHVYAGLSRDQFQSLLSISAGVLASVISQIQKDNENVEFLEVIETLCGYNTKYERAFIKSLIKNEDDPNLIESSDKIALDHDNDNDDDQSLLGGYAGGR